MTRPLPSFTAIKVFFYCDSHHSSFALASRTSRLVDLHHSGPQFFPVLSFALLWSWCFLKFHVSPFFLHRKATSPCPLLPSYHVFLDVVLCETGTLKHLGVFCLHERHHWSTTGPAARPKKGVFKRMFVGCCFGVFFLLLTVRLTIISFKKKKKALLPSSAHITTRTRAVQSQLHP